MTGRDALPPASPPPLPPPAPLLPPCRVCGAEASGFHYGLNTCEACKGFFRRAVARKDKLVCSLDGRCNVVNGNRSACAACRWKKCVQLGMSKTAYKRGRYTYEKKAADIREVKALQQRQAETQTDDCAEQHAAVACGGCQASSSSDAELETIITRLAHVHVEQTRVLPHVARDLPQLERDFLERRNREKKASLSHEEYIKIYNATGVDVDSRRALTQDMMDRTARAIIKLVTFAKALPGFSRLSKNDQVELMKANKGDVWMIMTHKYYNPETGTMFSFIQQSFVDKDIVSKMLSPEAWDAQFEFSCKLQKLRLRDEEVACLIAVNFFLTDRCALEEPWKVEQCLDKSLECLTYELRKNHPNDPLMLAKVLSTITELRSVIHRINVQEIFEKMRLTDIQLPPVIRELWNC